MPARLNDGVLAALGFEMVPGLVKRYAGALLDVVQHLFGKIDMAIETGADSGPAKRNFAQCVDCFLYPRFAVRDLLRVPGEFLSKPHRRGIHQMRSAYL